MHEEVIFSLKKSNSYLSGEELSRSLNISRAAIWKNIEELRKNGYRIEAISHRGYRLLSAPDRLLPREIKYDLNTNIIGKNIVSKEQVASTMDEAFRLGFDGADEGTVVCAEVQKKGRGRLGRSWSSPKGKGIYMSIILRPQLAPREVAKLTLLAAVSVCEALRKVSDIDINIKWPNDLLVEGRKLAGILTELSAEVDRVKFVVIGIGININTTSKSLMDEATSLRVEGKRKFDRIEIMQEVLRSIESWYEVMKKEGFSPVFAKWREHSMTLGKNVCVSSGKEVTEGIAVDIDEDGGLLIKDEAGNIIKKMSGDVQVNG